MRLDSRKSKGLNLTRKKEIDRDRILDAAESVILESGGRNFTLDAVAARAGISKGGLVYSFATKDGLVRAALEREVTRFQEAVDRRLGGKPVSPFELVLAHIEEALDEDDAATRKAAFLVTALVHAPRYDGTSATVLSAALPRSALLSSILATPMAFVTPCLPLREFSCSED